MMNICLVCVLVLCVFGLVLFEDHVAECSVRISWVGFCPTYC